MANEDAMKALMSIEGFRSLNTEINDIIIASEKVKKAKAESDNLSSKEKKELTDEEKEYKSKRKLIQEKLIKFATRIPAFMYLSEYREYSLRDVITQLESGLFNRVTGLDVKDFELLVSLGVFNGALMNDAVYKFKRYEDSSLSYTGIDRHVDEAVGGYDTVLTRDEYDRLFRSQQVSISEVTQLFDDLPDSDLSFADDDEKDDTESISHPEVSRSSVKPVSIKPYTKVNSSPKLKMPESVAIPQSDQHLQQTAKPKIDISEIKAGITLAHATFGKGKVLKIIDDKIIVVFGKAEKMFLFPKAIQEGFLRKR
jgi:hypothetical protein